jgi:hypothetical protein
LGLKQTKIIKPQRLTRELRALGLETEAPKPSSKTEDQSNENEEKSNEGEEKTNEDDRQEEIISTAIYSAITSDPGEPSTFEEAFWTRQQVLETSNIQGDHQLCKQKGLEESKHEGSY